MKSLTWTNRILLGVLAFAGTAVYAASFALLAGREAVLPLATAIAIAAGASWPVLGLSLLAATRLRPGILEWADVCLVTMSFGIAGLMAGVLWNLTAWLAEMSTGSATGLFFYFHLAILVAADVLMAAIFMRRARALGLNAMTALMLWVLALNGTFVLVIFLLRRLGGQSG